MEILDMAIGIVLIWGVWKGLKNGLLMEVATLLALVAGIYGAIHFSYITGNYLSEQWDWNQRHITIMSFILTFLIILIAVNIVGKVLTNVINFANLGGLNKVAGGLLGALKFALIIGAFLIFFDRINENLGLISNETKEKSVLYNPVKDMGSYVFDRVLENKGQPKQAPPSTN